MRPLLHKTTVRVLSAASRRAVPRTASIRSPPPRLPNNRIDKPNMHSQARSLHPPSFGLGAEETIRIIPISHAASKVGCPQSGKVILSKIAVVHEERQIRFRELVILLESGDKVMGTLVKLLGGLVHSLVVDIEPVRKVKLDNDAVNIVVQID
jgi:hypothetical protein